tara:strand:- start:591 stop:866 length:276 start_codon:yes stop_codon:yes gene_type:complete
MNDKKEKPATFTPGPWHVRLGEDYYHVHGEVQVALVENWTDEDPRGNARLIASAPEMHELLVRVSKGNGYDSLSLAMDARELLAKVEGGEG